MLNKRLFTRGTLGMALAASVFIGCQDFLGGDKGPTAAAAPSSDEVLHAAKEGTAKDSATNPPKTTDTSKPVAIPSKATEPAPTAAAAPFDSVQTCVDLSAQMQKASDPLYGDLKNKYSAMNCLNVIAAAGPGVLPPVAPLDAATKCKMIKANFASGYQDPKYPITQATVDSICAEVPAQPAQPAVTEPAKPTPPPRAADTAKPVEIPAKATEPAPAAAAAPFDSVQVCVDLSAQMQNSKDPLYGEFKDKYSAMNCLNVIAAAGPGVLPPVAPLDAATKCKMIKANFASGYQDPKYPITQAAVDSVCAGYP